MDEEIYPNGVIFEAVREKDYARVSRLIDKGEDIEEPGDCLLTPLALAVLENKVGENNDIVCLLLNSRADPNVENCGCTTLGQAVDNRNPFIVQTLLNAGALIRHMSTSPVYDISTKRSLLHIALDRSVFLQDHHDERTQNIVKILLRSGADVFAFNFLGKTATYYKPKHNNAWRIVHDMQERILVAVYNMRLRPKRMAMAMAQHHRIGSDSVANCIDPDILRMIFRLHNKSSTQITQTADIGRYSRDEQDDHMNFPETIEEQEMARELTIQHAHDDALTEIEFIQLRAIRFDK
ncbi:hypothetical protein T484DRAFT_1757407 [Baffinella frigidus]|nr:hypothetical protein T484DRAFT_1757407 [Cryptophyta sp. CCMP2293]